jgi:hypothetical protein
MPKGELTAYLDVAQVSGRKIAARAIRFSPTRPER